MKKQTESIIEEGSGKIMRALIAMREAGMEPEMKAFMARFEKENAEQGKALLEKAHDDGLISYSEWTNWAREYDLDYGEAKSIFECYYLGKKNKKDRIVMLTDEKGKIWQMKSILETKLGLHLMNKTEFILHTYDNAPEEDQAHLRETMKVKSREDLVKKLKKSSI